MSASSGHRCDTERVCVYALHALPSDEVPEMEAHLSECADCRQELESLRAVIDSFADWPTDLLRPSPSLADRLARRIAEETNADPVSTASRHWTEPDWEEVVPGISCKILADDTDGDRISMLVRLGPGVDYPPHTHAGVEELYLLDGELWINDRKLHPGDYNRGEPGTTDKRVWSETGCTCLLITSPGDVLR